jgi:hypothetical protein
MSERRSSSTDCKRPYGQATMHTCSRIQPKSSSIRTVVAAMTRKAIGCSAGEPVTQRASALTPTK